MTKTTHLLAATALPVLFVLAAGASAELVVNGGFEDHSFDESVFNMDNADFTAGVVGATGFGAANEIDILSNDDLSFDLVATAQGSWSAVIHSSTFNGLSDALSLTLTESLVVGQRYRVELMASASTTFGEGDGPLEIGVSEVNEAFGTLVHSFDTLSQDSWAAYSAEFTAAEAASFLTLRAAFAGDVGVWAQIDGVSLIAVPAPGGVLLAACGFAGLRRRR